MSLGILACPAGCIDSFQGSNVQIELSAGAPAQAPPGEAPTANQLPSNVHWRLYAIQEDGDVERAFEIQRFEVHKIIDVRSPCFIDVGPNVPYPGIHVSQFATRVGEDVGIPDVTDPPPGASDEAKIAAGTAVQRMRNVAALASDSGIKVVTAPSENTYPIPDSDCDGGGIPDASCIDDASNDRRLKLCQAVWANDPALFEGTDRVLTSPLNGTTNGFVAGLNPINFAPVGGAQFFVDEALEEIDEYALFYQEDGMAGPGTFLLSGRPTQPTRGVRKVHLSSPITSFTAELVIFENLGEDDVHF